MCESLLALRPDSRVHIELFLLPRLYALWSWKGPNDGRLSRQRRSRNAADAQAANATGDRLNTPVGVSRSASGTTSAAQRKVLHTILAARHADPPSLFTFSLPWQLFGSCRVSVRTTMVPMLCTLRRMTGFSHRFTGRGLHRPIAFGSSRLRPAAASSGADAPGGKLCSGSSTNFPSKRSIRLHGAHALVQPHASHHCCAVWREHHQKHVC